LDPYFLVGAVLGSGLYLFFGREPARRLVATLRRRLAR
jgi:hypothetical protein